MARADLRLRRLPCFSIVARKEPRDPADEKKRDRLGDWSGGAKLLELELRMRQ